MIRNIFLLIAILSTLTVVKSQENVEDFLDNKEKCIHALNLYELYLAGNGSDDDFDISNPQVKFTEEQKKMIEKIGGDFNCAKYHIDAFNFAKELRTFYEHGLQTKGYKEPKIIEKYFEKI